MNTFSKLSMCAGEANVIYQRMKDIMTKCNKTSGYDYEPEYYDTEECLNNLKIVQQSCDELKEKLDALIEELGG